MMKFAIVGCQHYHIKSFIEEMLKDGHQFAGIYDQSDYNVPQQYAASYGVPLFRSMDELLEQGVEIIGNAGPNLGKIDVIEWAEKHGIHVMTDKPVVIDENGLNRLRQVIDRNQIKIGMMLTARFAPAQYTLKGMIDEGLLARIDRVAELRGQTRSAFLAEAARRLLAQGREAA